MGQIYSQLSIEERNWIHRLLNEGSSLRQVAREVGYFPSDAVAGKANPGGAFTQKLPFNAML